MDPVYGIVGSGFAVKRIFSINLVYIWKKDNKNYVIEGKAEDYYPTEI